MPFISRGKTIGFKRISPYELTLRDLLIELSSKKFVGRVILDGRLGNDIIILKIEKFFHLVVFHKKFQQ